MSYSKNWAAFCLYPENLNEAEFNSNGLICLVEGV